MFIHIYKYKLFIFLESNLTDLGSRSSERKGACPILISATSTSSPSEELFHYVPGSELLLLSCSSDKTGVFFRSKVHPIKRVINNYLDTEPKYGERTQGLFLMMIREEPNMALASIPHGEDDSLIH